MQQTIKATMCFLDWHLFLEFLKVTLSWPPLAALVLIVFMLRFRTEIGKVLNGLNNIDLPGGLSAKFDQRQSVTAVVRNPFEFPGPSSFEGTDIEETHSTAENGAGPSAADATGNVNRHISPESLLLCAPGYDVDAAITWVHLNPGPATDEFLRTALRANCERAFNLIFGTQILVLEHLAANRRPHPIADLVQFHARHVELTKANPAVAPYFEFLQGQNLVRNLGTADGPLYEISEIGLRFLDYIKQFYPLYWNSKLY